MELISEKRNGCEGVGVGVLDRGLWSIGGGGGLFSRADLVFRHLDDGAGAVSPGGKWEKARAPPPQKRKAREGGGGFFAVGNCAG